MQLCCHCSLKSVPWNRGTNSMLNVCLQFEFLRMIYGILKQFQLQSSTWKAAAFPLIGYLDFKTRGFDRQLNSTQVMRRVSSGNLMKFGDVNEVNKRLYRRR